MAIFSRNMQKCESCEIRKEKGVIVRDRKEEEMRSGSGKDTRMKSWACAYSRVCWAALCINACGGRMEASGCFYEHTVFPWQSLCNAHPITYSFYFRIHCLKSWVATQFINIWLLQMYTFFIIFSNFIIRNWGTGY